MKLNIVLLFSVILLGSQMVAAHGVLDSVATTPFQTKEAAMILPSQDDHQQDPRRTSEGDHDGDHGDGDHGDDHEKKKPWGKVMGYSLLVNLITLSGVILLAFPSIRNGLKTQADEASATDAEKGEKEEEFNEEVSETGSRWPAKLLDICLPGFSAGALLATVAFLIAPEALYLLNKHFTERAEKEHEDHRFLRFLEGEHEGEEHDEHEGEFSSDAIWRFGAALMGG